MATSSHPHHRPTPRRSLAARLVPIWISFSIISAGLILFGYVAVQQSYRNGADDPQQQLAEDTAAALQHGQTPQQLVGENHVAMATSLTPFIMVLDSNCNVVASSGSLGGSVPTPPPGALEFARQHSPHRFTWEPQPGVREAAVVVSYDNAGGSGYVLAARSLREVENREDQLTLVAGLAVLAAIAASLLVAVAIVRAGE